MKRNWGRIARHYLAGLGSLLFYLPYEIWKGAQTVYNVAKKKYVSARDSLLAVTAHVLLYPLYSAYRMLEGTYELVRGRNFPWAMPVTSV